MKLKTKKSWSKILLYTLIISMGFCFNANAQETNVTGTVKSSEDGFPIPGVAVVVQGTTTGAVTDFDGNYVIKAKIGDVLVFSYLGMVDEKIKVTGSKLNVTMDSDLEDLEEVVVIGYGTQKKKEIAGAVAQVKADDINQFVTPDVTSAMQGQIAGVNITANSGEPGAQSSIQIRGISSLSGTNEPLYVIDGIPQQQGYQLNLASNEIETIDVLKDAASAAVYGTRGAAGVILITTRRGEEGSMKVSFDHSYGIQDLGSNIPLMNAEQQTLYETTQYNFMVSEGISPPALPGPTRAEWLVNDTDLRSIALVENAESETYNLNVSGGTKSLTYNVSAGYSNTGGILFGSNFKRYNGRANTTYNSDNWKINASIGFTLDDRDRSTAALLNQTIRYRPYFPVVDPTASVFFANPEDGQLDEALRTLAQALKRSDNQRTDRINTSLSITRNLTKELSFTTRLGTNVTNVYRNIFRAKYELLDLETGEAEQQELARSGVEAQASRLNVFSWDGSFNYRKKIGKHSFNLLAAASIDERTFERFAAARNGVTTNAIKVLDGASLTEQSATSGGLNYVAKNVGFLGRLQYNYAGKYILSALVRRDGSSKFSDKFRWGSFPSISLAWNVSSEKFWKPLKPAINNFKIRLSRGTVGNDSFSNYVFSPVIAVGFDYPFDPFDSSVVAGSGVNQYANPEVKWETSVSRNIGVDLGFLKNKVTLTADYYITEKEDMLFPIRNPGSTGVVAGQPQNVVLNIGNMINKGLEIGASYKPRIGKSKLTLNATFTKNTNEITKILDGNNLINNAASAVQGEQTTVFTIGREAAAYYLFETEGVLKTQQEVDAYTSRVGGTFRLGDLAFKDQPTVDLDGDGVLEGDGVINDADRVYAGSGLPDFELGFNLRWNYKNIDLSMNWYASVGAEIINGTKAEAYNRGRHRDLANMWSPANPDSNIPFLYDRRDRSFLGNTDLWLENGDYLRLKLVSLGYSLNKDVVEKIGLTKLRMYVSAQNPLTITGYSGYDPEIGGNNIVQRGIDNARFPLASLYSVGLNIEF